MSLQLNIMILCCVTNHVAAGSSKECWGKSGAPLVTHSSQPSKHVILAGLVKADDCSNKAPNVSHLKLDAFQQWIADNLHPGLLML